MSLTVESLQRVLYAFCFLEPFTRSVRQLSRIRSVAGAHVQAGATLRLKAR